MDFGFFLLTHLGKKIKKNICNIKKKNTDKKVDERKLATEILSGKLNLKKRVGNF